MNKLTKEEFIAKYGDYVVTFEHYYKYTFRFQNANGSDLKINVGVGGNNDEIYRFDFSKNTLFTVKDLDPFVGEVMRGDDVIDEFYDY
jgi:hypothetical protein